MKLRIAIAGLAIACFKLAMTCDICIDAAVGEDKGDCDDNCCISLDYAVSRLNDFNNINITIAENTTITNVISFTNFTNLTITGRNKAKIECSTGGTGDVGLYFDNGRNLLLEDLTIQGCSMLTESSTSQHNSTELIHSYTAVYVINCNTVSLNRVKMSRNFGTGVSMYDTGGEVSVIDCTFSNNAVLPESRHPGGGGMYVEFTCRQFSNSNTTCFKTMENSSYRIMQTTFSNNSVFELYPNKTKFFYYDQGAFQGFGRGGGLCLILNGYTKSNSIEISNCTFVNNTATTWGGGMYLSLRSNPQHNSFTVVNTHFLKNKCEIGGGGLKVSLLSYNGSSSNNSVFFENCTFTSNQATINGGGTSLVSSRETSLLHIQNQLKNTVKYIRCNWTKNSALLGAGFDISPGVWHILGNGMLPVPCFYDCIFDDNYITLQKTSLGEGIEEQTGGVGILMISNLAVDLHGSLRFTNNNGSAIYLQSGLITLRENSQLILADNTANKGAAVTFIAFSVMYIKCDTIIIFENNKAVIKGGAIYTETIDKHEKLSSRSCFLQRGDRKASYHERNVTIVFKNNTALSNIGNTIYANTLQSCMYNCNENIESEDTFHVFDCLATIEGLNSSNNDISTHERSYKHAPHLGRYQFMKNITPGKYFRLPITSVDELNQTSKAIFDLSLKEKNDLTLDNINSAYVSNQTIRVYGPHKTENNTIVLTRDEVSIFINVTTVPCPPGHHLSNDNLCICDPTKYKGIWKCDRGRKVASIINGFWIGACSDEKQCTGFCPAGYCTANISTDLIATIDKLSKDICAKNREGKLCGRCTKNTSAYYHSVTYMCEEESLCNYGILFYILSEIIPLTVLFIVIISCNISFTNGIANGFIFYAQILQSLLINFYYVVYYPKLLHTLYDIQIFIYSISYLNFFHNENLSFCLWKGATALDLLVWTYVTIIYALFLMILTVLILNRATCKKLCKCWRTHTLQNAVVHGLTAFLVMCYSQCARVSFRLLSTTDLQGYALTTTDRVVQYSGEHRLFDSFHLIYGLTAIAFVCAIVILPPLLLLLYPLSLNILGLCRLSELAIVNKVTNIIPVQLFDSFQSCYKDRYRFFSGLYFLYRIFPLLIYANSSDNATFFFLQEIFLILVLSIHAVVQPYKNMRHNVIDSLIFSNLAIINAISLFNYQKVIEGKDNLNEAKLVLTVTTSIQLILIYLPLVCLVLYTLQRIAKWAMKKSKQKARSRVERNEQVLLDSTYLPPLREVENGINYKRIVSSHPFETTMH